MYLGVDIGGTKTLIALFNSNGELKESFKFPTPGVYEQFLNDLALNVAKLSTQDFQAAGVAVPGRLDREEGRALGYGTLPWEPENIAADIEKLVHCPVIIENDAKLAGLAEAIYIKNEFKRTLYVTIGTGISCALITNGIISPDLQDSEGGQILVDHQGRSMAWEDVVSGRAIVERFGKRATDITDDEIWKTIAHDLSLGIVDLISVIQPEIIIMGGGVSTNFKKFETYLQKELKRYETPLVPIPPIRQAKRPEEAVIYGCYQLIKQHHGLLAKEH